MTVPNINNLKKQKGFTIVELLIVIIVIGILATLILIAYGNITTQASDAKRKANAGSLRDAIAAFKNTDSSGNYPLINNLSTTTPNFTTNLQSSTNYNVDKNLLASVNVGFNVANGAAGGNSPTGGASSANPDQYTVQYCPTSTTNLSNSAATGVVITYWQASSNSSATMSTGTGTGC